MSCKKVILNTIPHFLFPPMCIGGIGEALSGTDYGPLECFLFEMNMTTPLELRIAADEDLVVAVPQRVDLRTEISV